MIVAIKMIVILLKFNILQVTKNQNRNKTVLGSEYKNKVVIPFKPLNKIYMAKISDLIFIWLEQIFYDITLH